MVREFPPCYVISLYLCGLVLGVLEKLRTSSMQIPPFINKIEKGKVQIFSRFYHSHWRMMLSFLGLFMNESWIDQCVDS